MSLPIQMFSVRVSTANIKKKSRTHLKIIKKTSFKRVLYMSVKIQNNNAY